MTANDIVNIESEIQKQLKIEDNIKKDEENKNS